MATASASGTWTWSDAWILASISGNDGMPLSEIIEPADAHNHAIPMRDELASALGNLIGAGLIESAERGFWMTRKGRSIKKHWKGGMFGWSKSLLPQLERLPRASDEYPITNAELDDACAAYSRRI